jgi:hypothetical protein
MLYEDSFILYSLHDMKKKISGNNKAVMFYLRIIHFWFTVHINFKQTEDLL